LSKAALSVCGRRITLSSKTSASREDGTWHHTWKVSQNEENYIYKFLFSSQVNHRFPFTKENYTSVGQVLGFMVRIINAVKAELE
jgi:hypothetical protein